MARDWETWLQNSIGPASATEEDDRDRTESRIRAAIAADPRLASNIRVFVKGSYANNTNVRRDSDVDIAVEWTAWAFVARTNDASSLSWDELGVATMPPSVSSAEYRLWISEALVVAFGASKLDLTGNKAITVAGSSTTLDADVVPCFQLKRWSAPGKSPNVGTRLYPQNGGEVDNWPQQHQTNSTAKNQRTGRRYKQLVRALKRLENDMVESGRLDEEVHGYFIECLLYNLPDKVFQRDTYRASTLAVLVALWEATQNDAHTDWVEVNGLKWLWRSGQSWTVEEAAGFAHKAWNYVNS